VLWALFTRLRHRSIPLKRVVSLRQTVLSIHVRTEMVAIIEALPRAERRGLVRIYFGFEDSYNIANAQHSNNIDQLGLGRSGTTAYKR